MNTDYLHYTCYRKAAEGGSGLGIFPRYEVKASESCGPSGGVDYTFDGITYKTGCTGVLHGGGATTNAQVRASGGACAAGVPQLGGDISSTTFNAAGQLTNDDLHWRSKYTV